MIYDWPSYLIPYRVMFYLQPHVGGAESPLTRIRKTYLLTAPRWIARLTFRLDTETAGAMDAWLAQLKGGGNLARFHDWRRPSRRYGDIPMSNAAAAKGASQIAIGGFEPGGVSFGPGDYIGGDGRPHLVTSAPFADATGVAMLSFEPPLAANVGGGQAVYYQVTGVFQLVSEDAGQNETEIGDVTTYTLDFAEDLSGAA